MQWARHIPKAFLKSVGKCLPVLADFSDRARKSLVCVCMLASGWEWKENLTACPSCLSKVVGICALHALSKCHDHSAHLLQQGDWRAPCPCLPTYANRLCGECRMTSTSTSISGEHLSCLPPFQLMPPDQQMNLPHI